MPNHGHLIDLIKFGWGTALVTRDMDRKAAVLADAGVGFYFGGWPPPTACRRPVPRCPGPRSGTPRSPCGRD